jgi:hypothetical protein
MTLQKLFIGVYVQRRHMLPQRRLVLVNCESRIANRELRPAHRHPSLLCSNALRFKRTWYELGIVTLNDAVDKERAGRG